ncbi:DUF4230 domain-containing protein [Clostridium algidicarnis]|uniref:DUF4230 domain-containing protein n=1 Tax=Clostridium algidicarnis TaxID=37659 RepID=A0ABS6C5Y8_9CLOT|nr:DUF4230 domain-containing protein [Clostridium algidicarnis]MBU3220906.1 DUF4230 domain-containing protein [Clostridium algidicarnis]
MRRFNFKNRIITLTILAVIFTSLGFYGAYKLWAAPKKETKQWVVPNLKDTSHKFFTEEALIQNIVQKQEMITTEVELNQKTSIDDSWGSAITFKKIQHIYFYGRGIFVVNLSNITKDSISINGNKLTLTVPKPYIKSINIDEEKTIYETPEKGIFRFGEVKLTPEEYEVMMTEAKNGMKEKLSSGEIYEDAVKNSEVSISKFVQSLFSEDTKNNYIINIKFEE